MNPYNKFMNKLRNKHEIHLREMLRFQDFTIVSQNCMGGIIYHMLGMPMLSPTINMFIKDENFVKLAENPYKYIHELEPDSITDSYEMECGKRHPVIKVGDIKLNCLHYENCEEAIIAWNRRRKRVNFDKLVVIATSWDLHENEEYINRMLHLECPHILFTYDEIKDDNCVMLDHSIWKKTADGEICPTLTAYYRHGYLRNFEKVINVVDWINNSFEKKGLIGGYQA